MIIPSAVLGQEVYKAHGLTQSQGFDRVVYLLRTHLQQAWIVCWKGWSDRVQLLFRLVRPHLLTWILQTMSLLAELLQLLIPALELMADKAASLGLEVNWQKTQIQALGRTEGVPLTITVKDHEVTVAEEFVYLGSLIHSSVQSTHDINCRSAIAHAAIQSLDNHIWRSRVSTSTK